MIQLGPGKILAVFGRMALAGLLGAAPAITRSAAVSRAAAPETQAATPAVILVVTRFDDPAPGLCASGTDCSLREAVIAANSTVTADTITLPSGVYTLTQTGIDDTGVDGDLDLKADATVTVIGAHGANVFATIGANAAHDDRIFHVLTAGTNVTMTNLIIRQGDVKSNTAGGGVRVESGTSLRMVYVTVRENLADGNAGGILNIGELTLVNSSVRENIAIGETGGGGIFNDDEADLILIDSQVISNSANHADGMGGGIYSDVDASVVMTSSQVLSNTSGAFGVAGALLVENFGAARLFDTLIAGNRAGSTGGAIFNDGVITAIDTVFTRNEGVGFGGGIFNRGNFQLTGGGIISNSIGSGFGGGLYNVTGGRMLLSSTLVLSNAAGISGGGLYNGSINPTRIINSVFAHNHSDNGSGGGIYTVSGLAITNTTISTNRADSSGGGVYAAGSLFFNNVTVANNTAQNGDGGGIFFSAGSGAIQNTLLASNADLLDGNSPDCSGTFPSADYNVIQIAAGCTFSGTTTHNQANTDPVVAALEDIGSTLGHPLLSDGPAVDQGNDATCAADDQRGIDRPVGAHCDVGALEGILEIVLEPFKLFLPQIFG
jgi:hypothetical protein